MKQSPGYLNMEIKLSHHLEIVNMKKILLSVIVFLSVTTLSAQTPEPVRPLTPKELSERLALKFKMAAYLPIAPITYDLIVQLRKKERASEVPKLSNADSLEVRFLNVPGLNTGDPEIPVRVYKPKNLKKAPVFVWCHGGGFVAGELNSDHQRCADIALRAGVVVISVDYRLAPEHKFPAGVNDALHPFCGA
jgi:acetyl esterase/lipase